MKTFLRIGSVAAGIVCLGIGANASAKDAVAGGTFQVRAVVPMACWVDHSIAADALSGAEGLVTEGCNNPAGYIVSVSHRELAQSEHVSLHYGDKATELGNFPTQEINREYGPTIQKIAYRFESVVLDAPLTLSLTIQPL